MHQAAYGGHKVTKTKQKEQRVYSYPSPKEKPVIVAIVVLTGFLEPPHSTAPGAVHTGKVPRGTQHPSLSAAY